MVLYLCVGRHRKAETETETETDAVVGPYPDLLATNPCPTRQIMRLCLHSCRGVQRIHPTTVLLLDLDMMNLLSSADGYSVLNMCLWY